MKAIILSVKPKCIEKILNCEKTIEIRRVAPKIKEPLKVYIYCTKGKPLFRSNGDYDEGHFEEYVCDKRYFDYYKYCEQIEKKDFLNGKIVGEFVCDKIYEIITHNDGYVVNQYEYRDCEYVEKSCLTFEQINKYLGNKNGYALHISQLKIYGKPKELSEFDYGCPFNVTYCDSGKCKCQKATSVCSKINKKVVAPKNYCFVCNLGE